MSARILPALAFSLFSQWVGLPNFDLQAAIQAVEERGGDVYVQDGGRLEPDQYFVNLPTSNTAQGQRK
jgi:hypothetical protein